MKSKSLQDLDAMRKKLADNAKAQELAEQARIAAEKRAEAERESRAAIRLIHLSGKPNTIVASGRHRAHHVYHPQVAGLSKHQALAACQTLHRKGRDCVVIPPKGAIRVASTD